MEKAHQRLIREQQAENSGALFDGPDEPISDFSNARVEEIDYKTARDIILRYEWLGNMGTTQYAFGLFFGPHLAGVVCFGRTAGSRVFSSVCGEEHKDKAIVLCRGACVHWAHPHSASYLIPRACKLMVEKGYNIFIAYSDPEAGEIGTVYQACNWSFCGWTSPTQKFRTPDGEVKDARLVHAYTRDRRGGTCTYKRTRAEQKKLMIEQGYEFFQGQPKRRYVGFYGDKRTIKALKESLNWDIFPYDKRV